MEEKLLLFEGKTTMGGKDVDLKIYKVTNNNLKSYEWDYNPHLVDKDQMTVHLGEINRGDDLETIFYRINMYKEEIKEIKKMIPNPSF